MPWQRHGRARRRAAARPVATGHWCPPPSLLLPGRRSRRPRQDCPKVRKQFESSGYSQVTPGSLPWLWAPERLLEQWGLPACAGSALIAPELVLSFLSGL